MEIYITKGVQQIGPFSEEEISQQLESGEAKGTDLAWCEGRTDWVSLSKILDIIPEDLLPPQPPTPQLPKKARSVVWMTVWAFLWPGMGQVLCGQRKKGIVVIILGFFILLLTAWTGIIPLMLATASAIDAFKVAKRIANGKTIGEWEFFPDEKH